jgi:hypothetical protein
MKKLYKQDLQHLLWVYDRMKNIHHEDKDSDYMVRFREIISKIEDMTICSFCGEEVDLVGFNDISKICKNSFCNEYLKIK